MTRSQCHALRGIVNHRTPTIWLWQPRQAARAGSGRHSRQNLPTPATSWQLVKDVHLLHLAGKSRGAVMRRKPLLAAAASPAIWWMTFTCCIQQSRSGSTRRVRKLSSRHVDLIGYHARQIQHSKCHLLTQRLPGQKPSVCDMAYTSVMLTLGYSKRSSNGCYYYAT